VEVHNMVGAFAFAIGDNTSARAAWDHALTIDPNNTDALAGIAALLTAAKKAPEARSILEARLAKQPEHEGLLLLAGKVRLAAGDPKGAETALRHLIEISPQNLQAYALLGQMFVLQKRISDAKQEYLAVLNQRPRSVPAFTMMGLLSEAENNIPKAVEWYQKALQIDWRPASVAENNLAWIYAQQGSNLDVAVQLAESATAAMPTQADFYDTLGWVYYKKQVTTLAIRSLKRAVDLDASNPV